MEIDGTPMAHPTHGLSDTPTMRSWTEMKRRCYSEHRLDYPRYGGAGITVCARWLNGERGKNGFECFVADLGIRPKGMTLDRIDNKLGYFKKNCRWAPRKTQERNKSNNRRLSDGRTIAEAAEAAGINYYTLHGRLSRGYTEEQALSKKSFKSRSPLT